MLVPRLLIALIFALLLIGSESRAEALKTDSKASPPSSECQAPGTSQPMFCNYRLVVKKIKGNLFQGYVDPKLVSAGEKVCKDNLAKRPVIDDQDMSFKDFKCQEAKFYTYFLYQFEIEGEKPRDDEAVDLVNIPFTNKLKKGHVGVKHGTPNLYTGISDVNIDTIDESNVPVFQTKDSGYPIALKNR